MRGGYIESSRAKAAAGDASGAFADALHAVRLAPDDWVSHAQVALTAEALGESETGRLAAEQWANRAPASWQAHAAVGRFNMALNRAGPARFAFHRAWQLNPNDLDVYIKLTLLELKLESGRQRRTAIERAEQLVSDGHLDPDVLSSVADDSVTGVPLLLLSAGGSWITLIYFFTVWSYDDTGSIGAGTALIPVLASAAVATFLLLWFVPLWRRLPPATRRRLPGMFRREPSEGIGLIGHTSALVLLLAVPLVWATGAGGMTVTIAAVAFALALITEIVAVGLDLGRSKRLRDFLPLLLQPPYITAGALVFLSVILIVEDVRPRLRRLFRR